MEGKMILTFIRKFGKKEEPKKPYTGATIERIHTHHHYFSGRHTASIHFKNGGEENFEAKTLEDLIEKVNNFMEIV
jgi:coproporphyrinogen III oxidase-like Fe-S oxidoreductase